MWYVYLLECGGKNIYTGITKDVEQRFGQHRDGKGGRYTRSHKPIKLLYSEKFQTKSEALKREIQIKRWPREKKLNLGKEGKLRASK